MSSPARSTAAFDRLAQHLAGHGLNLLGGVPIGEFDRAQPCGQRAREIAPACGTILVAGSGGSDFWTRLHQDALGRGGVDLRHADLEARSRQLWAHKSDLLALLASAQRDPKKGRPFEPADFGPHRRPGGRPRRRKADVPKVGIGILKDVFVR